jgi:hypothetical protein
MSQNTKIMKKKLEPHYFPYRNKNYKGTLLTLYKNYLDEIDKLLGNDKLPK